MLPSIVKLFYFLCDYWVGYLTKTRSELVSSTLVIFDRYYCDILIDPLRYRYGAPLWLARLVGEFIPKPDLVILLNAPPEILQERKKEVSFEETCRQQAAYLEYVKAQNNGCVIDASQPLGQVVHDVEEVIVESMANRLRKRA